MSRTMNDLAGQRFGKIVVNRLSSIRTENDDRPLWECVCDCGKMSNIRGNDLKSGKTKSCGKCDNVLLDVETRCGLWTVIGNKEKSKHGHIMYKCHCDCGTEKVIMGNMLDKGKSKSCGCLYNKPKHDLTGMKFAKFTVLGLSNNKTSTGRYLWNCQCECGELKEIDGTTLKSNHTKSCGCIFKHKDRTFAVLSGLYGTHVSQGISEKSKKRNNTLTFEQYKELILSECYYCGHKGTNKTKDRNSELIIIHNGIDRVDSHKEYTIDNCVSCCSFCNSAKSAGTQEDYIARCKRVAQRFQTKENT